MDRQGMRDMPMWSLNWHHGQHRFCGSKRLFPWSKFYNCKKRKSVQQIFTILILEMQDLSCQKKWSKSCLCFPAFRRMSDAFIEIYKVPAGCDKVQVELVIPVAGVFRTRGHSLKIEDQLIRSQMKNHLLN